MMEFDRHEKKIPVPQQELDSYNKQMYAVRVWHQLIYDTDPNLTNLLITKDWQLWIIDFTRAFRLHKDLRDPKDLVQCDRRLLARLRALDKDVLKEKFSSVPVWSKNPSNIQHRVRRRNYWATTL